MAYRNHRKARGKHRKTSVFQEASRKLKWSALTSLSTYMCEFISMLIVAHLGVMAVASVAATTIVNFLYGSVDRQGLKAVTAQWVGQSMSEKKANLSPCLARVKQEATGNQSRVLVQYIADNSLVASLLLGLSLGTMAIAFPQVILELGGADSTVVDYGMPYFQIVMGCVVFNSIVNSFTSTLNGLKENKSVTKAAIAMLLVHLSLALPAVYFFDFGLVGVAWANVIATVVQVVLLVRLFYRKGYEVRFSKLRFDWRFHKEVIRESWPLILDKMGFQLCIALYWRVLQQVHGADVLATQRIANQIMLIPLALFSGLYPVINAYVASHFGDKMYRTIRSFVSKVLISGTLCCLAVMVGTCMIGPWLAPLFLNDTSAQKMVETWLLYLMFTHSSNTALQIIISSLKGVKANLAILLVSGIIHLGWGTALLLWGEAVNLVVLSLFQVVATLLKLCILGWYFFSSRKWVPKTSPVISTLSK
jgi:Na+-driven multidrug efflux pump